MNGSAMTRETIAPIGKRLLRQRHEVEEPEHAASSDETNTRVCLRLLCRASVFVIHMKAIAFSLVSSFICTLLVRGDETEKPKTWDELGLRPQVVISLQIAHDAR